MFLCTCIVLKASSCVTFSVIFAYRASIICIDSGTCDTIRVSLALGIRFFDISINRYTFIILLIVKKLWCWVSCFTLRPQKLQYKLHPEFWLMKYFWNILLNIFSYVQAGLWMVQSVRLSITPFSLCSHHHIIMKLPLMKMMSRSEVKDQGHIGQNPI